MKRTLDDDANEEMMTIDEADNYVLCYVPNLLLEEVTVQLTL